MQIQSMPRPVIPNRQSSGNFVCSDKCLFLRLVERPASTSAADRQRSLPHHNRFVKDRTAGAVLREPADPGTAAHGGRGLETMCYPLWDVMGDWAARTVEVEDWMDVPLAAG